MMDTGRSFVEAGNNAPERPAFESMMLSILTALRKQITQLDEELEPFKPPPPPSPEKPPAEPQKPAVTYLKKRKPGGEQTQLW